MFKSHLLSELTRTLIALERRYGGAGSRRRLLVMLTGWIGFYVLINMFMRSLNKVTVPVLNLPLDVFLAMQGVLMIFVIALLFFAKQRTALLQYGLHPVSRTPSSGVMMGPEVEHGTQAIYAEVQA